MFVCVEGMLLFSLAVYRHSKEQTAAQSTIRIHREMPAARQEGKRQKEPLEENSPKRQDVGFLG